MKRFVKITTTLALAASSLLAAQQANALAIKVTDGVNTVITTDADNDGLVSYAGSIGTWILSSVVGLANPFIGDEYTDTMHLDSVDVSNGAGTLTIMLTDTDMTKTKAPFVTSLGGVTSGNISFATYMSATNTAFDLETLLGSSGSLSGGAFSQSGYGEISAAGPYSVTQVVTITHGGGLKTTSFNYEIKVPEPMTLALFGAGLIGMGFVGRRKRSA